MPKELLFYMHWLKARGREAPLVLPNFGSKKRQPYPVKMETTVEHGKGFEDYSHHKIWPELLPHVVHDFQSQSLAELAARVSERADGARYFGGTLSIHNSSPQPFRGGGIFRKALTFAFCSPIISFR